LDFPDSLSPVRDGLFGRKEVMPLDNLSKRIKALQVFDIERETISIINEYGWYISALLRTQLQEGKDMFNEPVTIFGRDYYKDATIFNKERNGVGLGKQTEFITNYDSGAFYMSLKTVAKGRAFITESNVPYFDDIIRRSGDKIMKLNNKHLGEFRNEILIPKLRERFKAYSR